MTSQDRPDAAPTPAVPHEPPADAVAVVSGHLSDVIRSADAEARRRRERADAYAAEVLADARAEASLVVDLAHRAADDILHSARAEARRTLAEAQAAARTLLQGSADRARTLMDSASLLPDDVRRAFVRRAAAVAAEAEPDGRRTAEVVATVVETAARTAPRASATAAPTAAPTASAPAASAPPAAAPRTLAPASADAGPAARGGRKRAPLVPVPPQHVLARPSRRGVWGRLLHDARWAVLAGGLLVLVLSALWGPGVVSAMSSSGFDVDGSSSQQAAERIQQTVGRQDTDVVALYTARTGRADTAAFRAAVEAAVDRVPDSDVVSSASFWSTGSPALLSTDGRSTFVALRLTGDEDAREATFTRIAPLLRIDPAVGSTALGGTAAIGAGIGEQVGADLTKAETLSAPFLTVLLILVFGSLVAALLPLGIGGLTVVGSLVMLRLIAEVTTVSVFAVNIVTLLGLGLSIDYALLVVSRFREECRAGRDTRDALAVTMATAGRSIAVSAVTVAATLAGLLFFPVVFLRSMAYGGIAAVAVAALASLTVLPALLAVLGHRVDALAVPWLRRRRAAAAAQAGAGPAEDDEQELASGRWARLARSVMRRPVVYTVVISGALLALASPVLDVTFGGIDERQLPPSAQPRVVAEQLRERFPGSQVTPIEVLVTGGGAAAADTVRTRIAALPDVEGVTVTASSGGATLLAVDYPGEALDTAARGVVTAVRDLPEPAGATVLVGGDSAESVDLRGSIVDGLPKMLGLIAVVTFLLLFWAFGSFVLPIKAMLMNVLAVSAALGVVVLVFQKGYGADLLGVSTTGFVELTQPILVLAILFGLSTDYEVFLLSRIREEWDARGDNTEAVAVGLQRTGPIITSAAALILVVIAAFSTSQITFIKLIGVGMAVAVLVDATIVRALLVPATMRLLGRWNWWAPGPLQRFWERHRPPSESGTPPTVATALAGTTVRAAAATSASPTERAATDEPAADEPVADATAPDEPAGDEPAGDDPPAVTDLTAEEQPTSV